MSFINAIMATVVGVAAVLVTAAGPRQSGSELEAEVQGQANPADANRAEIHASYMLSYHRAAVLWAQANTAAASGVIAASNVTSRIPSYIVANMGVVSIYERVPGEIRVWSIPSTLPTGISSRELAGALRRESRESQGIGVIGANTVGRLQDSQTFRPGNAGATQTHVYDLAAPAGIADGTAVKVTRIVVNGGL